MIILNSIIQILDIRSGVNSITNTELDLNSETSHEYVINALKKVFGSSSKKRGWFNPESKALEALTKFKNKELSFTDLSSEMTNDLSLIFSKADEQKSFDLLIASFREEEKEYFALLALENKEAITHFVESKDGVLTNRLIKNFAILPTSSIMLNNYFIVDLESYEVFIQEKSRLVNNEEHKIFEEYLNASFSYSTNDQYRIIKNATAKVCEENGLNPFEVLNDVKEYIIENASEKTLSAKDIAKDIFKEEAHQIEFENKLGAIGITNNIVIEKEYALKKYESQKIRTDNGIEIIIPQEFINDKEHLEFVNEADGTISIKLKNINRIVNK